MRNIIISAAFAAVIGLSGAAYAAPLGAAPVAATQADASGVIPIAELCGRGWHRGPHGGCLRNHPYARGHMAHPHVVRRHCAWRRDRYGHRYHYCR